VLLCITRSSYDLLHAEASTPPDQVVAKDQAFRVRFLEPRGRPPFPVRSGAQVCRSLILTPFRFNVSTNASRAN
jgi:hypothetical protein